MSERFSHARIDDLERIDVAGVHWRPVRRRFGITAFGTNAYSADAGELLIEPHDETAEGGGPGQEEMYVVIRGRADFVVDGETIDAAAGTIVFIGEPTVRREATAREDGTVALAVGGRPGAALPVSGWEHRFYAAKYAAQGDYDAAYETAAAALEDHPDSASAHYDLASFRALKGDADGAFEHLERALALDPDRVRRWAAEDRDLDALRDDPRFPRV